MKNSLETMKPSILLLVGVFAFGVAGLHFVHAFSTSQIGNALEVNRYRMSTSDVTGATSVDPVTYCGDTAGAQTASNSCKRVVVVALPSNAISMGVVSNVTTRFAISGTNTDIKVTKVTFEDGSGNLLSSEDIAMPPDLNTAHLENRVGSAPERQFYGTGISPRLVYYVYGRNSDNGQATSLNSLTAGQMDAYVASSKQCTWVLGICL